MLIIEIAAGIVLACVVLAAWPYILVGVGIFGLLVAFHASPAFEDLFWVTMLIGMAYSLIWTVWSVVAEVRRKRKRQKLIARAS